jgi:Kip1 ubiquitination-promoting complex protein 1
MDAESSAGNIRFANNHLSIESLSNFSSARATSCVYKGRWMYEVTLGTAGIQQLGWATMWCPFTNEEGVGDATDSYAYDGKRRKKWNVSCSQYGDNWAAGDVIGCAVDLEKGEISFYRNGVSLGTAFSNVQRFSPGMAYFPAISMSHGERCDVNFGSRPLAYPVPDYATLQDPPPESDRLSARYLVDSLARFARVTSGAEMEPTDKPRSEAPFDADEAVLFAGMLASRLGPLLRSEYIVVDALVPCLLELHRKAPTHLSPR